MSAVDLASVLRELAGDLTALAAAAERDRLTLTSPLGARQAGPGAPRTPQASKYTRRPSGAVQGPAGGPRGGHQPLTPQERAERAVHRVAATCVNHSRNPADGTAQRHQPGDGCTGRCLTHSLRGVRPPLNAQQKNEALRAALIRGWIVDRAGRFHPGVWA